MAISIRDLHHGDRSSWEPLWAGYLEFYRTELPPETTDATWQRLVDDDAPLHALAAVDGDDLLGFAHYLLHPTTWTTQPSCYLEDLFVASSTRGTGVGRLLIEALVARGRERNWSGIHWLTAADNATAMLLYDRIATKTTWVRYEIDLN